MEFLMKPMNVFIFIACILLIPLHMISLYKEKQKKIELNSSEIKDTLEKK